MFTIDEDHDEDRDDTEDADFEDENSDEDEDSDDDSDSDEDEDADSDDDSDSDEDSDEDDSDDEDKKPVTRGELKKILKSNQNRSNAKRRVDSKKGRDTRPPSKTEARLSKIEQSQSRAELLERKRQFGYDNGLSPKEVDVVFRLTRRPTKKFLAIPYVKGAIDAIREQSNVRSNTPRSSGGTFKTSGGKDWKDLKPDERQANFSERRQAILDSKGKK